MSGLDDLFRDARNALSGAPRELLGQWRTPRKVLGFGGDPRIVAVGTAWHLGRLLILDDGVAAIGQIVRAHDPGRRGYTAQSSRERAAVGGAALRGGIPAGAVVHIGWQPIDLDAVSAAGRSDPISLDGGVPMIRWSATGGLMPLRSYLAERVELLLHPPGGT